MATPALQLLKQSAKPKALDDQQSAAQVAATEAAAANLKEFFDGMMSQMKRIIHGDDSGEWHDDISSVFGSDASLKALLAGSGSVVPDKLRSNTGEFVVPSGAAVRDLVFISGSLAATLADNSSIATGPVVALILDKPTATTATLAFAGKIGGFSGLTPGDELFVGSAGGIVTPGSLPNSEGNYMQRIGVALNATSILLSPGEPIIL